MQTIIDELLRSEDYLVNRYIKIYTEVLSKKNEKNYLYFQYIVENSVDIHVENDEDISEELSNPVKHVGQVYFDYLEEVVNIITRENYCPEEFYQRLYKTVFDSELIRLKDVEYGIILYFLAACIKGLPYYQANNIVRLSDDQFERIVKDIEPSVVKGVYMINRKFGYNTEIASQLCDLSDELKDRDHKAVFWAIMIGTLKDKKNN